MHASWLGREAVVRLLLERGARLELQDEEGWTAMHWAIVDNRAGVLELLCSAPGAAAALALGDHTLRSPLAKAILRGHAACEAVLRAHGATT